MESACHEGERSLGRHAWPRPAALPWDRSAVGAKASFFALARAISVAALLHPPGPAAAAQVADAPVGLPRMVDGKPNLSGIWQATNTAAWDIQDHGPSLGVPAGIGVVEGSEIPVPAGGPEETAGEPRHT